MKLIYELKVDKTELVKKEEKTNDGVLIREVEQKVPVTIGIAQPNRRQREEADWIYSLRLSECINAGILSKALMTKKISEQGGVWSEQESEQYKQLYESYESAADEYTKAKVAYLSKKTEDTEAKLSLAYHRATILYQKLNEFQDHKSEIFNECAENKARNRVLLWYLCYLTHEIKLGDNGEALYIPLAGMGSFEKRLENYDAIVENGEAWQIEAFDNAALIISLWYSGRLSTPEDVDELNEVLNPVEMDSKEEIKDEAKKTRKARRSKGGQ